MQNKDSFVLYTKYIDTFKELTDEQAGKLIKVILEYVNDMNPEPEGLIKIAFIPIKQKLKEDLVKWKEEKEKRSLAGKKGMESRYSSVNKELTNDNNVSECYNKTNTVKDELTNLTDNVNVYVNVNDNDNDNVLNNNNNNNINNIIASVELPLIDKTEFNITQSMIDEWQKVYTAIDVKFECERMRLWLEANPLNKKTRRGISRFINAWLSRSQDRAPKVETKANQEIKENLPENKDLIWEDIIK